MTDVADHLASLIEPVARELLGEPNKALSSKKELRFGARGSLSVDLEKGTWYDHEANEGGGTLDLVTRGTGRKEQSRFEWLDEHGYEVPGRDAPRTNGHARHNGEKLGPIVAAYDYTDESGDLLFQVTRHNPKDFRQRSRDRATGEWTWKVKGVRQVPYRLPELIEAISNEHVVFVVEGEKDADNLWKLGAPATTNAGGTGKWRAALTEFFSNADVVIIQDNDPQKKHPKTGEPMFHDDGRPILPGQDHAQEVARALDPVAVRVRVLDLAKSWPAMPPKGDVSDWIKQGGTLEALFDLIEPLPAWSPDAAIEPARMIKTSEEFVAGFVPPEYVIGGVLQRRFCYAFTAKTGSGKTAIMLLWAALVALGTSIGDWEIERGRVLYFAGENPDDIRMRWIAMAQQMGFDIATIDVNFIPGSFKISEMYARIRSEIERSGDVTLVMVDTSSAFFEGTDENDNKQAGEHARRLRTLASFPGGPCVVVACHPPKNAGEDNLQPRGGGAFIAEVDGNLTAKAESTAVEVHWQGKFRGPDFAPILYQLRSVTHERLKDSKGRLLPTVVAQFMTEIQRQEIAKVVRSNEDQLLALLAKNPAMGRASQGEIASMLGWYGGKGEPYKVLVGRTVRKLKAQKLIIEERDALVLTKSGEKHAGKPDAEPEQTSLRL